jgi:hypothetical protein
VGCVADVIILVVVREMGVKAEDMSVAGGRTTASGDHPEINLGFRDHIVLRHESAQAASCLYDHQRFGSRRFCLPHLELGL